MGAKCPHRRKEANTMKMITAIVNKEDSNAVSAALTKAGFSVTKLSTTGGFLKMCIRDRPNTRRRAAG